MTYNDEMLLGYMGWGKLVIETNHGKSLEVRDYCNSKQYGDLSEFECVDSELKVTAQFLMDLFEQRLKDSKEPLRNGSTAAICAIPIPHQVGKYHYMVHIFNSNHGDDDLLSKLGTLQIKLEERTMDSLESLMQSSGRAQWTRYDPRTLGYKILEKTGRRVPIASIDSVCANLGGTYSQYKWVFHPDLVQKIIDGKYEEITPLTVEIDPSLDCTNRCTKCAYIHPKMNLIGKDSYSEWERNHPGDSRMVMRDWNTMKLIIDRLKEAGTKALVFTGGGEPMLSTQTVRGIRYARENGLEVILYSNGSVFSQKSITELCEAEPTLIRISLNAGTEEVHRRFHNYINQNTNFFPKVMKNIEAIARSKTKKTTFGIGVVVNEINVDDLCEVALRLTDITKRRGTIDFVTYRPEFDYFGGQQLPEEVLDKAKGQLSREIPEILKGSGIELYGIPIRFKVLKSPKKGYAQCRANYLFGEVAPNGDMYICCERHFMPKYYIGSLVEQSVRDIWGSGSRREVVNNVNRILEMQEGLRDVNLPEGYLYCPPGCKPHPFNRLFEDIERARENGQMGLVKQWIQDLRFLPQPSDTIL